MDECVVEGCKDGIIETKDDGGANGLEVTPSMSYEM